MLRALLICFFLAFSSPALAIYKCVVDGKVSYGQDPCPGGTIVDLGDSTESQPRTSDAAKIRKRTEEQKKEAAELEKARHKREVAEEKAQKAEDETAAKKKRCDELAKQGKPILPPNNAITTPYYQALREARLAADKLEAECKE